MDILNLWKKLNYVVKSSDPQATACRMLNDGRITDEEAAWCISALAYLPVAMYEVLEKKR
jgi:hypothetical protein